MTLSSDQRGVTSRPVLKGFVPVLVTPFDEKGRLRLDWFAEIVGWELDNGADGLCVAAGNGEASELTATEIGAVVRTAHDLARGIPIIAGAMGPEAASVEGAAARIRAARDAGADAVLVTPDPTRPEASRHDVLSRYRAIYGATQAPIVAYNSPRHYGVTLDATLLGELADAVDLAGLKESSRDFHAIGEVLAAHAERFPVFVGPGWFIMPGIAQGAAGFLSTGPDLLGRGAARIAPLALAAPGPESRALHRQVGQLYHLTLESGLGPSPGPLKAALAYLGLPAGVPRDPAKRLGAQALQRLTAALDGLGLRAAAAA